MKPKVYATLKLPPEAEERLSSCCEYRRWEGRGLIQREVLLREIKEVEGLVLTKHRIDRELLAAAPKLKIVSNVSVGYNNFDLEAMKERGVMGTNTPGVLDETVADLVFGLLIAAARRIPELDRLVKAGRWQIGMLRELCGLDVNRRTLGIIGLGRIGEAIARRAIYGFGMRVLYHNRRRKLQAEEKLGVQYRLLDDLLQEADFVVLMTPLTPQTRGLLGYREFCLMKPTAVFVNASRGPVVQEEALVAALREGRIFGAGLDVYAREPIEPHHPLLQFENVVTLPHIGAATDETLDAMGMLAVENMLAGLSGRRPPNLVEELQ